MKNGTIRKVKILRQEPAIVEVVGITLLSTKEAERLPSNLRTTDECWWLRSLARLKPFQPSTVTYVNDKGYVNEDGCICNRRLGVRPALIFSNLRSLKLAQGDEIKLAGYRWTVISGDKALCNDIIGQSEFYRIPDNEANEPSEDGGWCILAPTWEFEHSDIKKFLEAWAAEKGILSEKAA